MSVSDNFSNEPARQRTSYILLSLINLPIAPNSDTVPQYLRGMLHKDQLRQLRSNSSALQLVIPRTKKCIGDRAFSVYATRLWNGLPVQIRNTPSHRTFKKSINTFLFRQYFSWKKIWLQMVCDKKTSPLTSTEKNNPPKKSLPAPPPIMKWSLPKA